MKHTLMMYFTTGYILCSGEPLSHSVEMAYLKHARKVIQFYFRDLVQFSQTGYQAKGMSL